MLTKSNGGDNPFTEEDESREDESTNTSQYEEQLHQWVNYGIYLAMINDDLDFAKAILVDLKKWRWQIIFMVFTYWNKIIQWLLHF